MHPDVRHDVRPAPWRFALMIVGLVAFVAIGVGFVIEGSIVTVPIGLLAIAFFGGFGGYALYRMTQGMGRIAILPSGIEVRMFGPSPRVIPWGDIEATGVLKISDQEFTTVRLSSYRSLLDGLTDDEARLALRHFQAMRWMGRATVAVASAYFANVDVLKDFVSSSEHVKSVAAILRHARETYGAELLLSWNMRDRNARAFSEYLESCRAKYRKPTAAQSRV